MTPGDAKQPFNQIKRKSKRIKMNSLSIFAPYFCIELSDPRGEAEDL